MLTMNNKSHLLVLYQSLRAEWRGDVIFAWREEPENLAGWRYYGTPGCPGDRGSKQSHLLLHSETDATFIFSFISVTVIWCEKEKIFYLSISTSNKTQISSKYSFFFHGLLIQKWWDIIILFVLDIYYVIVM